MSGRPTRDEYVHWERVTTRWADIDVYGHMNNARYFEIIDTVVNNHLTEATRTDIRELDAIGVVAEVGCRYFAEVGYPEPVDVGVVADKVGTSSVVYRVGLFQGEGDEGLRRLLMQLAGEAPALLVLDRQESRAQLAQLLLGPLALGRVHRDPEEAGRPAGAVVGDGLTPAFQPADCPVRPDDAEFGRVRPTVGGAPALDLAQAPAVVGVDEGVELAMR